LVDEALIELEKAISLIKDDAIIRDHLGDVYYRKGMVEKAVTEWKRALELDDSQEAVREKLRNLKEESKKEAACNDQI
jgi:tetratricopeptide (TPR) repeat protein